MPRSLAIRSVRIENSFIPVSGVGPKTERALWERGATEWDRFEHSLVGATRADRISDFIDTATERLDADDAEFFADAFPARCTWRLYENFRESACFLDIETTGLRVRSDEVTVVGLHFPGEDRTRTLIRGRDLDRESLAAELAGVQLLVTFNGKTFDLPALEHAFDIDVEVPHFDLRYACGRLGLTGGLEEVEYLLGIERTTSGVSGRDAVRLWHEYQRGDEQALDTLVAYNRDDVANLEPIADAVVDGLDREVFASVVDVE